MRMVPIALCCIHVAILNCARNAQVTIMDPQQDDVFQDLEAPFPMAWHEQNNESFIGKRLLLLNFSDSLNPRFSENFFLYCLFENKLVHLNVQ